MITFYTGSHNYSLRDVRDGKDYDGLSQVYSKYFFSLIQLPLLIV